MAARETPEALDETTWDLLLAVAVNPGPQPWRPGEGLGPRAGENIQIRVSGCAYSCCGKGWQPRHGYEQEYAGYVDNLDDHSFMLYSRGIGTISYVVAVRFSELLEAQPA